MGMRSGEHFVFLDPFCLVLGNDDFVVDGLDRADGDASTAIDTYVSIDVEHLFAEVEALDRADAHALGKPTFLAVIE